MCDYYVEIEVQPSPAEEDPPTRSDLYEARLARLRRIKAETSQIGWVALNYLLYLLSEEFAAMARLIAREYEAYWDDDLKLEIVGLMAEVGMEPTALMFCQRWLLSQKCMGSNWNLHIRLLPPLPPRETR